MTDFRRVADDVRNWGRWGDADELGTLNFITAGEGRRGRGDWSSTARSFRSAVDFGSSGPQGAFHFRQNPLHVMTVDGGDAEHPGRVRPGVAAATRSADTAQRVLRRQPVAVQRRHDHHAAAGRHPVGCAVARVLRGQAVQRFPGELGDQPRRLPLRYRQGRRKGITSRGVLLDIVAHARRGDVLRARAIRSRLPNSTRSAASQGVSVGPRRHRRWSEPVGGHGSWRPATAANPAPGWTGRARRGCTTTRSPLSRPTT